MFVKTFYPEKLALQAKTKRRVTLHRLKAGLNKILLPKNKKFVVSLYLLTIALLLADCYVYYNSPTGSISANILAHFYAVVFPVIMLFAWFFGLYIAGTPKGAFRIDDKMKRICVKNDIDEAPALMEIKNGQRPNVRSYIFLSYGIPLSFFEDNIEEIESAMNVNVADVRQGKDRYHVVIRAADYESALPDVIPWDNRFIDTEDFNLTLGKSLLGPEVVDLNTIPHILIGGSTGSGKTILLKNLLYQAAMKEAVIYIADFKGGVDFNKKWHRIANVITDIDTLIAELDKIVKVLEDRKLLFHHMECANLREYNQRCPQFFFQRVVFGCDEIAELLDKTGALNKAEKEKISTVEKRLSTIARQGRAFGIHLILATQRPDANILNGQIRNNMDLRICGRADDVLSKIILDNTDASERIPKYEKGLFLTNTNMVIRGYYFTDNDLPKAKEE